MSALTVASDGSPTTDNDSVCDVSLRQSALKADEKEFVLSVRNLLIFKAGACMLSRKITKRKDVEEQIKEVFETKCRLVDLDQASIVNHCDGLTLRRTLFRLMKLSLVYASFKGKELSKGSTLWNTFQNQRSEFKNLWMYNYLLKSGETKDNDAATIERMVPHLWVIMKNKSAGAKRNRLKQLGGDADAKKISNSTLDLNMYG